MSARFEKIIFPGSQGFELAARLDWPEGEPRATVLFAHCFTCSKEIFAAARIATELADRGYAVFRFDFTGLGMSEGDFANTNFSSNVQDLIAAADHLRKLNMAPELLVGHSFGGAAVLAAAESIPEARAIATIGAPSNAHHVMHNFADHIEEIRKKGEAQVNVSGRPFRIKSQFLEDIESADFQDQIKGLRRALIIFHSPVDTVVSVDNAKEIFKMAKHPKSFVSLDGADHLLRDRADAAYVAEVLSAWASRYVGRAVASS